MTRLGNHGSVGRRAVARTLLLALAFFALLHPGALIGVLWTVAPVSAGRELQGATPAAWIVGAVGCVVVAFWPARPLAQQRVKTLVFVGFEGLFLGGFVTYYDGVFPGVMLQLSFAAFSAVIGALAVLSTERVRSLPLIAKVLLVIGAGYAAFALHNVGFSDLDLPIQRARGAGSPVIPGVPLGLILGLLLVPLTSYTLVRRIDQLQKAAVDGVEPSFVWRFALGIVTTIMWPWDKTPGELLARRL